MSALQFDHIIVGAGTAGCLLANRLSADPHRRVLLIEAGGSDNYAWIHIPVGYLYCIGNPRTDWMYHTEAQTGLNGRSLRYPRGRALGGCSSINGMIYMRGQSRDYAHWQAATGDAEWGWEACLADFRAHENHYLFDSNKTNKHDGNVPISPEFFAHHGAGGEWRVDRQRLHWDVLDAFAQAAVQAGVPASADFNQGNNEGVGYFEVNQKNGWRWNASKAFLRPVAKRPNLTIWTHTSADTLVLERDAAGQLSCTGVNVVKRGQALRLSANVEVLLCAGAVASPHLLQRSGIGPGSFLQDSGVRVELDAPGVGANLQDHLQIRAVYQVSGAKTLNTQANSWLGKAQIALEYALWRTGPMSMAPSQLGAFTKSRPDLAWPNLQYHVQPLSLDAFGEPLHAFAAFTASVCNLNPTSRGHVRLKSPRFDVAPAISPNYLSTPEDTQVAAESLRVTRRIVSQPALARFSPQEYKPGVQFQSDAELARLAGDIATTIFHPVGTCAMGKPGDAHAVLDSHMRVQGVRGLRVVDASAMPSITSGNTNSPTLMMAEKAARWIAKGR